MSSIKGFFLSWVIFHVFRCGIFEHFRVGITVSELCKSLGLDAEVMRGIARFLLTEGIIENRGQKLTLTAYGKNLRHHVGWFTLFVGGYGPTMQALPAILDGGKSRSVRNEADVAFGSGEIDCFDLIPLIIRIIRKWSIPTGYIVDLGCGSGSCLIELCTLFPLLRATGVAMDAPTVSLVTDRVRARGLLERISIVQCNMRDFKCIATPDLVLCAFVLQEVAYQEGVPAVKAFLTELGRTHPGALVLVVEVPKRESAHAVRKLEFGPYYSCYSLIHSLTRQRLLSASEWRAIFCHAGYRIVDEARVEESVDPFGVEVGYLLRYRAAGGRRSGIRRA